MKKYFVGAALLLLSINSQAQNIQKTINADAVKKVISVLAADDMRGRKAFTPDIDKAADYIAATFKKAGLAIPSGQESYLQSFSMYETKLSAVSGEWGALTLSHDNIVAVSTSPQLDITEKSDYTIEKINAGESIFAKASGYVKNGKNTLVLVDPSFTQQFKRLAYFGRSLFSKNTSTVFLLSSDQPTSFSIKIDQNVEEKHSQNVVGIIPGTTKPDEYVIFSGHYDHLGVDPKHGADSIYNGANDDASGTTAVILLADYFKKRHDNARTLVFTAFTAEEEGGFGSQYFSQKFDPAKVAAMFNIEMIGTDSKWGNNSAYITGYEKTNMGEILQKNLTGSKFKFYPDPYTDQQLFYRSDNATLARQGVPAHTISTSKMDNEPNYHKLSDEVSTLDMNNMAEIIQSIAISAQSIIAGKDTPSRVDVSGLR